MTTRRTARRAKTLNSLASRERDVIREPDKQTNLGLRAHEVDRLLGGLLDSAVDLIGAQRGSVMLPARDGRLRIRLARGMPVELMERVAQDPDTGVAGRVIRAGQPEHLQGSHNGRPLDEALVLPLRFGRDTLGTLNLSRCGGDSWAQPLRERTINFVSKAGEVIEVVRLGHERERRLADQERQLAYARVFGSTRDLDRIVELLLGCARELTGSSAALVDLEGKGSEELYFDGLHPPAGERVRALLREGQQTLPANRIKHLRRIKQLAKGHPLRPLAEEGLADSLLQVPLVFGYRQLGRLFLLNLGSGSLRADGLRLLNLLCQEAAVALDQSQAMRELQQMAFIDPLTRLANRHYWMQRFAEELTRAARRRQPLSLLLLDIDHFKLYNDTYGHQVGDQVLRMVADVIRSCIREVDAGGRYGGEEFGVLLPETGEQGACGVAERIRIQVAKLRLGNTVEGRGLTISIGVATIDKGAASATELIGRADAALLASKAEGRNRVRLHSARGIEDVQTEALPPTNGQHGGLQLILAGCNSGERLTLGALCERSGCQVRLLESGDGLLAELRRQSPELVLLDVREAEGLQLLENLKRNDPLLPVMALVARESPERAAEAVRMGADDYLRMPCIHDELRRGLEKMRQRRMRLSRPEQVPASGEGQELGEQQLARIAGIAQRDFREHAARLRLLQEFNRRSLEHPIRGALMIDRGQRLVQANRRACEMIGLREDEYLGRRLFELVPALDDMRVRRALIHLEQTTEEVLINDIWLRAPHADTSQLHKLQLKPVELDSGEGYILITLENLLDRQVLEEERARLRSRILREVRGEIAQQLQLISTRGELLMQRLQNTPRRDTVIKRDLLRILEDADRIDQMLADLSREGLRGESDAFPPKQK